MDIEKSIPELKTYYSDYRGDAEALKKQILSSVSDSTTATRRSSRRLSKSLYIGLPCALLLMGAGIAYHSTTMTQPHAMTKKQIQQLEDKISEIVTHYGNFERTSKAISLPPDEIAHDTSKVTAKTQEIILPYGVFVKLPNSAPLNSR